VPKKIAITFAASAVKDLEDMQSWYADQQVPDMGRRLIKELIYQAERLADFPESGRVVPEFEIANLREIIYPPYRIVYRLDRKRVSVVRVWRSERLLKMP
jgi:plasmid stabilization system protein ParE